MANYSKPKFDRLGVCSSSEPWSLNLKPPGWLRSRSCLPPKIHTAAFALPSFVKREVTLLRDSPNPAH